MTNAEDGTGDQPRNAVVILLDSLNRHMIGAYGGREFATPNLDRFAARSTRFTRHFTGSLPCMPARHDILCGALDFLWRPWGSVELWEDAITYELRKKGVVTQLISDHPHLFETGGENYHVDFTAWDYQRGHEGDPWKTRPDPSWAGAPNFMRKHMPYDDSRGYFRGEEDFPGPRTMGAAARWLNENAGHHGRFMLFVDEFDPHEPFDTPEPYASMYDPDWEGAHLIWPPYVNGGIEKSVITERQARQIRASYGGKLTMIDKWFGKILDELDAKDLWKDTLVILCTDHGHYLGEKDIWGKPGVPVYEPLGHIPLMIAHPDVAPGTCDALTTSVDLFATLAELFGVEARQRTHGRSLLPLMRKEKPGIRDWLLTGVWGREVHYIDNRFKYARGPAGDNAPLTMMSNRWSTMPTHFLTREQELPLPDDRAFLDRMPGSGVPVIHQQWDRDDPVPFWARTRFAGHHLYDLTEDPAEERNLAGTSAEADLAERLRAALVEIEAPKSQLERLGLN
ncbi:sulfatase [Parvibaculum lavamentivorans DS-1]|uniref:Sulfatase n=1 Tax=Parvibaculum lavamentivorans (strain DS-1 / DSM 13023 / NCIMB 13966) TaxID=402881 RepID=A7HXW1_PARL1|nr:sulfatase [Parvibaculum lavamentivorans]ABS64744.1 sulfatase [Parvibaculum lavamentivorans DS-1]